MLNQHGSGAQRIAKELALARHPVRRYLRLGGNQSYLPATYLVRQDIREQ